MAPLQFQPLSSQPTPSFWSALNTLKLDKLKLDDTQQDIIAWLEEGKEIVDRESAGGLKRIGVDGGLGVGGGAFDEAVERYGTGWWSLLIDQTPAQYGTYQGHIQELQHDRGVQSDRREEGPVQLCSGHRESSPLLGGICIREGTHR